MSNFAKLYWLTRLDGIQAVFVGTFILCLIAFIAIVLWHFLEDEELSFKKVRLWLFVGIFSGIVSIFIPSKNDAIFIITGAKVIDFVEKDTSISRIPGQTTAIVSKYLEDKLNGVDKKVEDEVKSAIDKVKK